MNLKMKCSKDLLLSAVNIALRAIPSKTTMDILNCILIIADETGFKLMSNDLEMGIETNMVECNIERSGSIAVDAKLFSDFLRSLPDGDISLECKENNLVTIKCGKTEFKLMGQDERNFPRIASFDTTSQFTLGSGLLKDMVRKTIFSVSSDESRPIFTGELFKLHNNEFTVVAADIYRISIITTEIEQSKTEEFIIPSRTLNELLKILPDGEEQISVSLSDSQVMFISSEFSMVSRLIAGNFIDYDRTFPKEHNSKLTISRNDLIKSLERASILSKEDKRNPVKLDIKEDLLIITSNTGISDFYEEIPIELQGEEITIGFNPKYIIDALRVIEDENVNLLLTSSLSPCIITGEADNSKYMVLPIKLRDI